VPESDELNNEARVSVAFGPFLPDLVPGSDVPSFAIVDENFFVSFFVSNDGLRPAEGFEVEVSWDGVVVLSEFVEGLSVGGSVSFDVELDAGSVERSRVLLFSVDSLGQVESDLENNVLSRSVLIRLNEFLVTKNFNRSFFLGDSRVMKFVDLLKRDVAGADVKIFYPSGVVEELFTGSDGLVEFVLSEGGEYFVSASKERFRDYEGLFEVEFVRTGFSEKLRTGEVQEFLVETEGGSAVPGAVVLVTFPSGEIFEVVTGSDGKVSFVVKESGEHFFSVKRNGVGLFESVFVSASSLEETVGMIVNSITAVAGETLVDWVVFLLLFLVALFAGVQAHRKMRSILVPQLLGESERKKHSFYRLVVAGVFFLLPLFVSFFVGALGGVVFALVEVGALQLLDFYLKKKRREKTIRVE
jgi:hypothetical protein